MNFTPTVVVGGGNNRNNHNVHVLSLSNASQVQYQQQQQIAREIEIQRVMGSGNIIDVPTLPHEVQMALRSRNRPVRFFGEHWADIRQRLRYELATAAVMATATGGTEPHNNSIMMMMDSSSSDPVEPKDPNKEKEEEVTTYTHATPALIVARQAITTFSLQQAQERLRHERRLRRAYTDHHDQQCRNHLKRPFDNNNEGTVTTTSNDDDDNNNEMSSIARLNAQCVQTYQSIRQMACEGSQYGDTRALSCLGTARLHHVNIVATASWTGNIQLWNGGGGGPHSPKPTTTTILTKLGEHLSCHEDRIMGMTVMSSNNTDCALLCTTSLDRTVKLWKVQPARNNDHHHDSNDTTSPFTTEEENEAKLLSISQVAHYQGHTKRLCRAAFHPMKQHVATTSFDYSWRLWDIETSQEQLLLLQDGHWKETYGIDFHPDGSLCATTDFASVIQLWDLRTGKSIRHLLGHAQRVLNAAFHPTNGYQLVSAGDDGTIKVWDIRQRKQLSSIPAHTNVITQLRFDPVHGEYLVSSSMDGTMKVWSTRTWKCWTTLRGHDGTVAGVDIVSSTNNNNRTGRPSIVSCGFDKTLKLWQ